MEKELNIAAILKDKPGAKLWSPIIGVCALNHINSSSDINVTMKAGLYYNGRAIYSMTFNSRGKYGGEFKDNTIERECMLFPSKKMFDWEKFAWKKGDVLKVATGGDCSCIFDRFTNDNYTEFTGVFDKYLDRFDCFATSDWCKVTDEKECESIIQRIETQYGGKLNLDTLKIEKPQFKDGDIMYLKTLILHNEYLFIYNENEHEKTGYYIGIDLPSYTPLDTYNHPFVCNDGNVENLRLATDSEKQQLFDALAKENKAWDAEKKAIVNLPKKCEFKPKDWCLMRFRGTNKDVWKLCQFGFIDDEDKNDLGYCAIGGNWFDECIPYNDQTAHLLGTTDDWKGGEA